MSWKLRNTEQRYGIVAMILHWTIAIMLIGQFGLGKFMTGLIPGIQQFELYQLHKSIGITILLLSLIRLWWRLIMPIPSLPMTLRPWERVVARGSHISFYVLMIAIPLTGWLMVSASVWQIPTILYNTVPWPHLPFFEGIEDTAWYETLFANLHNILAVMMMMLLLLHSAAALKHHFVLKDDVLRRMLPVKVKT